MVWCTGDINLKSTFLVSGIHPQAAPESTPQGSCTNLRVRRFACGYVHHWFRCLCWFRMHQMMLISTLVKFIMFSLWAWEGHVTLIRPSVKKTSTFASKLIFSLSSLYDFAIWLTDDNDNKRSLWLLVTVQFVICVRDCEYAPYAWR
jgi:hypothetical protein